LFEADPDILAATEAFVGKKNPQTDVERILCLGYCLGKFCGLNEFDYIDIRKLNDGAKLRRLSNPWLAARKARARGLIAYNASQKMSLTPDGRAIVDLLPHSIS
jgi:hypothetical protein